MSKSNHYKKEYEIDEFARHYYCQNARLRQLREDKHRAKKKTRERNRRAEKWAEDEGYEEEFVEEFVENS